MILERRTHFDCEPTLTDSQVLDFTKAGYLKLEGVVPDEVSARCFAWLDEHAAELDPETNPAQRTNEPVGLFEQEWFVDGVLCCPAVVGAVRSLLGADFGLPILLSNHRSYPPQPPQDYHHDGDAPFSHELHQLQVFYMPQATSEDMGPLELCAHHSPSSAFRSLAVPEPAVLWQAARQPLCPDDARHRPAGRQGDGARGDGHHQ